MHSVNRTPYDLTRFTDLIHINPLINNQRTVMENNTSSSSKGINEIEGCQACDCAR